MPSPWTWLDGAEEPRTRSKNTQGRGPRCERREGHPRCEELDFGTTTRLRAGDGPKAGRVERLTGARAQRLFSRHPVLQQVNEEKKLPFCQGTAPGGAFDPPRFL